MGIGFRPYTLTCASAGIAIEYRNISWSCLFCRHPCFLILSFCSFFLRWSYASSTVDRGFICNYITLLKQRKAISIYLPLLAQQSHDSLSASTPKIKTKQVRPDPEMSKHWPLDGADNSSDCVTTEYRHRASGDKEKRKGERKKKWFSWDIGIGSLP